MGASVPDSKFFGVPFGTSGDKATIPEASQPNGAVSYAQGFGPDYERDPATDPLAKRVPRDETNEFYFQMSNAIRFIQLYGQPEWYATDGAGSPVSYPVTARVRHAGAAWVSIAASNTAEPGTDPTKWVEASVFNLALLEATAAEALAGTLGSKIITPRRMAQAVQRGAWNTGVSGGTVNTRTLTLSPAPTSLADGMTVIMQSPGANTSSTVTLNVNGLGAAPIRSEQGGALAVGDIAGGTAYTLVYLSGEWRLLSALNASQTRVGLIEIATNAEVIAGLDASLAVTPAGLSARTALTTRTGVVALATAAEANDGTEPFKAMTPAVQRTLQIPNFRYERASISLAENVTTTVFAFDAGGGLILMPNSTFASNQVTIGGSEAGLWDFLVAVRIASQTQASFLEVGIFINDNAFTTNASGKTADFNQQLGSVYTETRTIAAGTTIRPFVRQLNTTGGARQAYVRFLGKRVAN